MKILELTSEQSHRLNDNWVLYLDRMSNNSKLIYKTHNGLALTVSNDTDVSELYSMIRNIDRLMEYSAKNAISKVREALGCE